MKKKHHIFIFVFFAFFVAKAGLRLDSIPSFPFINKQDNKIIIQDSTTLSNFFKKLWLYESNQNGQIKILHIGDSHIQGGIWTGKIRESFHNSFGCGTNERGFIFPYQLANTNGPSNYNIRYSGFWQSCKKSFIEQDCSWGISGVLAYTWDDSVSVTICAKNPSKENYRFNRVKVFIKNESGTYYADVLPNNTKVKATKSHTKAGAIEYVFEQSTDTLKIIFKKNSSAKGSLALQGFTLENDDSGISYSESGVNGAKVVSYLNSPNFLDQLKLLNPDLLVISLGTNDVFSVLERDSSFKVQYNFLLYQLKSALPNTNILLSTPGDFKAGTFPITKQNQWIRNSIFELAQKHNCAVWDWYGVMGGPNSIEKWYQNKLCAKDKIHLSNKGYQLQGSLMYNAIMDCYEKETSYLRNEHIIINHGYDWDKFFEAFYVYNALEPILFTQLNFWIVFTLFFVFFLFVFQKTKLRSLYILLFSVFFYYKTGGYYIGILVFSTLVDYYCGKFIFTSKSIAKKKFWLILSLLINLSVLGFFKYSYFFIELLNTYCGTDFKVVNVFYWLSNNYWGSSFNLSEIILPVGISFYTFQTMSYSIDIYRKRIQPVNNMVDFGFYVSFFPQLVAGPIVRANEFIPQIHQPYQLNKNQLVQALWLIVAGLFKKIVISDFISASFVDRIFDNPLNYSGFENLMGVYGYALQIYCDFSAYSDIAIGLSLLMGFSLPENFRTPYLSSNITDFWRRWHMSLSRWLKDYLYISLGGNRKGKIRTYFNLFLTMLIGGLWHGASLRFILWGALHGLALVFHKLFSTLFPKISDHKNRILKFFSWFITFHFVMYCWIFFRMPSMETHQEMLMQISNRFYWHKIPEIIWAYKNIFSVVLLGYLLHLFPLKWEEKLQVKLAKLSMIWYPFIIVFFVLIIYQFKSYDIQPFIYFQF